MIKLKDSRFDDVYFIYNELCTLNLTPGKQVYGEMLYKIGKKEYRTWDPYRSKLAAIILNSCEYLPITPNDNILYLGAANGTTASHISDIVTNGKIYCIEFSARAFRDLLELADLRKNIVPILENAFHPERYKPLIEKVDIIYQDLSQRDQMRAFIVNSNHFLKSKGYGILMIKSRSIDISRLPEEIFRESIKQLKIAGFNIVEKLQLEPYSKDHLGVVLQLKE